MPDIKQIKDTIEFFASLSLASKLVASVMLIAITGFFLSLMWLNGPTNAKIDPKNGDKSEAPNDSSTNVGDTTQYDAVADAIKKGNISDIKYSYSRALLKKYRFEDGGSVLMDLDIKGQSFDIATLPRMYAFRNEPTVFAFTKLLSPNRSIFAEENKAIVQSITALSQDTNKDEYIRKAINAREEYRFKVDGFFIP